MILKKLQRCKFFFSCSFSEKKIRDFHLVENGWYLDSYRAPLIQKSEPFYD